MLVGRDAHLVTAGAALEAALAGRGGLLLVAGEAGIGKSTLAQELAARARAAGAVVRTGTCWETEHLPAFTPWLDVLRRPGGDAAAEVARLLEGGDPEATDVASARVAEARRVAQVVDALYAVSATHPQLVLLEDLHWADRPSLALLAAVSGHLPSMAALVVATYRDDELPPANPLTAIGSGAERITLPGLDADAVGTVLEVVLGRPATGAEVAAVRRQTGGNPLFVTQVGRLMRAGSAGLPTGVRDVLARRLARLSTDCVEVLGAAAVLGHEFDQRALGAMVGADVLPALDEAHAAGLVEPVPDSLTGWRFVHALVQATRYAGLSAVERERWHRVAVPALRGRHGVSNAVLAHHATRGRFDAADPTASELLLAAGQDALARLAWEDAAAAFEQALEVAPPAAAGDGVRAEAWLGIGAARLRQDRGDAGTAFDEAAALARRLGRPDLVARAALGFSVGLGAFEVRLVDLHQIDLLEEAAAALDPIDPLLPIVLARLSVSLAFVDSTERRLALATRAVELARANGEVVALGHALAARCDATAGPTHATERLAAASEIVALGQRARDLPLELLGRRHRVVALFEVGDRAGVDLEIGSYQEAAAVLGDPLYSWYARLWQATRAHAAGRLDEAERLVEEAMAEGRRGGSVNSAVLGHVHRLMVAIDRRDPTAVDEEMAAMLGLLPETTPLYYHCTVGYVGALFGDLARARTALRSLTPTALGELPHDSEWISALAQVAVTASRLGDGPLARRVLDDLVPVASVAAIEGIGAYDHGAAHRFVALAAGVLGDAPTARTHVEAALGAVAAGGAVVEALAALDGARALLGAADPDDADRARELAALAAATFAQVGLRALAAEAGALLDDGSPVEASPGHPRPRSAERPAGTVARRGDTWAWTWAGTTVHVKHAKGVADLALLLERAGREVHVRELEGAADEGRAGSSSEPTLDETAVQRYRQRLQDLEEDLDEADRDGDTARAVRLAAERDALVGQLTAAFGLGGRARRLGSDPDERRRKAVSARVKASITRIAGLHPALGRHLDASVRTGFWCSYRPERPTVWVVERP